MKNAGQFGLVLLNAIWSMRPDTGKYNVAISRVPLPPKQMCHFSTN